MKCADLIEILNRQAAEQYAEKWDNVGLLVGDREADIQTIYLAVDATEEVIEEAIKMGADMILTHHPMIFGGEKKIVADDYMGRKIMKLVEHHIACYAMHTNFDIFGMSDRAAELAELVDVKVLDPELMMDGEPAGIGRYGKLKATRILEEEALAIKEAFQLEHVKVFGDLTQKVTTAAIVTGSGEDYIEKVAELGVDVYITGDIKHHPGIDAVALGLAVIDAGHYGLEHIFTGYMKEYLQKKCPELTVRERPMIHPFHIL